MNEHVIRVTRRARYYSSGDVGGATSLWVVIHGYGQLARTFLAGFEGLVRPGRAVLAPEALNRYYIDNGQRGSHSETPVGATWMTREHRDAEIADYVEYLDALVAAVRGPGTHLTVLGFSQGVATLVRWVTLGATTPDRVVCWAGQLPPDVDYAAARARLPAGGIELVVGTRDKLAEWVGVESQVRRLGDAGIAARVTTFDGGHIVDPGALLDLAGR